MEKAILRTLIYADIFDYPLKINEIHKWLIGRRATLRQLYRVSSIKYSGEYNFLPGRRAIIAKRQHREKQSVIYFKKAKIISQFLKIIPWIKLVGVSGGLAMSNASKRDDIDLILITQKNRLWISRLFCLGILSAIRQRRRVGDKGQKISGKICLNILLEEDKLEQKHKDIFVAHEVLQMKVLWQRGGIYSKFLEDNSWAFKFLPNWIGESRIMNHESRKKQKTHNSLFMLHDSLANNFENLAKKFQLKIMQEPQGMERIEDGALYFHPDDCRLKVLSEYNQSLTSSASF